MTWQEGWVVKIKRTYRLYVEEKLIVRKRKRRRRLCAQMQRCSRFQFGRTRPGQGTSCTMLWRPGRKPRTLSIEDAYTARCYLGFLFAKMPPVPVLPPVTDLCIAPFAALPAKLPTSGIKLGFAVVP
jgi:hypothetical protein